MSHLLPPIGQQYDEAFEASVGSVASQVLDSIDEVLALCQCGLTSTNSSTAVDLEPSSIKLVDGLTGSLRDARNTIIDQQQQLQEMTTRSEALARAQAEAIVSSAQIIEELGRTKNRLTEARNVGADTQRLADTILEQTNDGVMVLEEKRCLSCNDNALALFQQQRDELVDRWPTIFDSAKSDTGEDLATEFRSTYDDAARGISGSVEGVLTRSCGKSFWAEVTMSCVRMKGQGHVLVVVRDVSARKKFESELRRRALSDSLTGLSNRLHFREYLSKALESPGYQATICFIDLDDFKHVNDSAGHSAGDELLRQVACRISNAVPTNSFVARFGGDEFALIVEDACCSSDRAKEALDSLHKSFAEPFSVDQTECVVGLSIGVCCCPKTGHDVDTLMQSADIAMYAAKSAGKNRIRIFTSEMQDSVDLRHRVQSRLRTALSNGHLDLHFQPQVEAQTHRTLGCESLVRWKTEDGTYVPPSEFIPIAEQTGLIGPLGDLVFQKAAEQACRWAATGIDPAIAVNISPNQIRDSRFVQRMINTLKRTGARAEWFELEITEHAMMDDVPRAVAVTSQLAKLGFRIAIDDFGTGHSSLSYLKNFHFDTLKIDVSFVRDVVHDTHSQAIVRSIISLGHGLGLAVVAEGVENTEQEQVLTRYGCDVLQGYLFGRPVPAEDFCHG